MKAKYLIGIPLLALFLLPGFVDAATFNEGLGAVGETGFGSAQVLPPGVIIGRLISVLLGFLGVIFLILIIYAGFLWMTAAGNDSQVKKAKEIMITSVAGMVIVMSAYAIANFVINQLSEATGTG